MATKRTAETYTAEGRIITLSITGYEGAGVERTAPGEYWPTLNGQIVGAAMFRTADEAEAVAIAAWVAQTVAGEAELDELAVYCEACGCEVDPAAAALDGEQMVCQGCAPCTVAEFETAELALEERAAGYDSAAALAEERGDRYQIHNESHFDAVVWDTATSQSVWRGPKEEADAAWARIVGEGPFTSPIPAGADIEQSIERRAIFDALCEAADEARAYYQHIPSRLKIYNDGWAWLIEQSTLYFNRAGELLYPSESEPGTVHRVGVSCSCTAGRWGQHCKHAAAADIIGRARRALHVRYAA